MGQHPQPKLLSLTCASKHVYMLHIYVLEGSLQYLRTNEKATMVYIFYMIFVFCQAKGSFSQNHNGLQDRNFS